MINLKLLSLPLEDIKMIQEIPGKFVLACIDGSSFSEAVCDYSAWIAKTVEKPLKFLHTIEHMHLPTVTNLSGAIGFGATSDLMIEYTEADQSRGKLLIKKGQEMLATAKDRAESNAVKDIITKQRHGSLSESLIELEEEIRVLVLGVRGESHDHDTSGHSARLETVIRSLHKPILVVNSEFTQPKSVLLAYNGNKASAKAVNMVASSLLFKDIVCHLVNVSDDKEESAKLLAKAESVLQSTGVSVVTKTLSGKIDDALVAYRQEQDLDMIMMGAFSHHRIRDILLGSFTAKMLERTQRPLLLLR